MNSQQTAVSSGLGAQDVIFILLRHKYKLMFFVLLGIAAAGYVIKTRQPLYQSHAKLLVRYVTDSRALASEPNDREVVRSPDSINSTVINSEIEIFRSRDLAKIAARRVGPEKITAPYGGGTNEVEAAGVLMQNVNVQVGRNSAVMNISLTHRDPSVARDALKHWVEAYLQRHIEVHRAIGTYDLVQGQADQLRVRLSETEQQLLEAKRKANIVSVEQARTELGARLMTLRNGLSEAETQLAEARARIEANAGSAPAQTNDVAAVENAASGTNEVSRTASQGSLADLATHNHLVNQLTRLKTQEAEYLVTYLPGSTAVTRLREQIAGVEKSIAALGVDPVMASRQAPRASGSPSAPLAGPVFDLAGERTRLFALEAKIRNVQGQIAKAHEEGRALDSVESTINALERRKAHEQEQYRYFLQTLERARVDQTLDAGKLNNISPVQEPTLPAQDMSNEQKMLLIAFAGPIGFGLALAFALELFLDSSVKRSKELENLAAMRLVATIPSFGRNGHSRLKLTDRKQDGDGGGLPILQRGEIAPWDESDPMLVYYEGLRDRIIMSYEGDLHKPKIIGVTSCNRGAGVSRIATGLAAALSRDSEQSVLFVGLERNKVELSAFAKGRPTTEFADNGRHGEARDGSLVDKNLYSLATTGHNLAGASIVQSFSDLLPKLKESTYDFIVFDMPPLNQTSGSIRLASLMERAILVVEAEKTGKDSVQRAIKVVGNKTQVFGVLNKAKTYGPKFLQKEPIDG